MNVPPIEARTVMDLIDGGASVTRAKNPRMMWIVLKSILHLGGSTRTATIRELLASTSEMNPASGLEGEFFRAEPKTLRRLVDVARSKLVDHGLVAKAGVEWTPTRLGDVIDSEAELDYFVADEAVEEVEVAPWQDQVLERLAAFSPAGFERMLARLLGKAGVFDAAVTGRTGDGGIDGEGSMVKGVDAPVVFQAKRYQPGSSVSSAQVRDFRGAVQGRAHVGMYFTTGSFTKDARAEAERTQALRLILFDGAQLAEWIKELGIGVHVKQRMVEDVTIDESWWDDAAATEAD